MSDLSRRSAVLAVLLAASPLASSISLAGDLPLAIKGYDPVAYFTDGKPTPGAPAFEYVWDEHRYWFASAAHRDLFKADPVRYAPQFGNYCAMALALNEVVVANPENWLISDGKLYVFGKPAPAGPALFRKDLANNIAKANHNRPLLPEK
ncbi:MAG TPA: YHS domain-containing (seleno)protein [Pseudolabrys sp.]|nr:YHS domain-containing (seleno)protein [Pseudolabrys sp.]